MKYNKKIGAVALELIVSAGILGALGFGLVFMNAGNVKQQQQDGASNLRDDKAFIEDSKGSESMVVRDIILNTDVVHLNVGETFELSASVQPSNLWNTKLIWEIYKNPSKINTTVSGDTMKLTIKAVENGITKIKVRANDGSRLYKTVKVIVGNPVVFTASQRDFGTVAAGETVEMAVYANPADYSPSKVQITWSVEDGFEFANFDKNTNILKVTPKPDYENGLIRVHASAYDVLYEEITEFDFSMSVMDVYELTYNLNGFPDPGNPETYTKETPTFALKNPSLVGYTFEGWTGSNGTTPSKNVQITKGSIGDKTFTVNRRANIYKIHYNGNGATSGSMTSSNHTYDQPKALNTNKYERTGYKFTGWNTIADGSGTSYTDGQIVENLKSGDGEELTLYAQWSQIKYTLTIDPNGGYRVSDNNSSIIVGNNYTYGYVDTISERAKTGYQLTGYVMTNTATGSTTDLGGAMLTYNASTKTATFTQGTVEVTITAQWRPNKLTINYYSNNATAAYSGTLNAVGEGKNVLVRVWETDYEYNTTDNLHDYSYTSATTYLGRTGYTATGYWGSTTSGGTLVSESTNYASAKELASAYGKDLGAGDIVLNLYAQWSANTIKLTLNANGGSGGTTVVYYKYGTNKFYSNSACTNEITKITAPSKAGYNFDQYNGDGASGGNVNERYIYSDGTFASDLCTDITKDATLTAQWTAKTIKLTLNANGGSGGTTVVYYKYGTNKFYSNSACTNEITKITAPSRSGYAYVQHNGDGTSGGTSGERYIYSDGTFASDLCTDITKDATLTAQWRAYITQYRCRYWGSWSGWQNSAVSSSSTRQVGTQWVDTSYWGSWSGWQNSAVSSSSTRQVETKWVDTSYWNGWSGWQNSAVSSSSTRQVETQWIDTSAWGSWSSYSDTSVSASSTREVRTKQVFKNYKVYRYKWWNSSKSQYWYSFSDDNGGTKQTAVASSITKRTTFSCSKSDTGTIAIVVDTSGLTTNLDRSDGVCQCYTVNTFVSGSGQGSDGNWYVYGYNTKTQYSYRDWKSSGYTQYRYRDYVSQGYTQYRYRDYVSQGYTQYRYRDMGSWSSWTTSDCSSGYADRQTRYGDYGA